ncbi:MAG: 50S ribosomal protein L22 [Verrucomicrobiales bacterium]
MEVKAITRHVRISPLKVRDVVREICGLPASQALDILNFTPKKAAYLVGKTLRSGIANAENNHEMSVDRLVVKEAQVGEGPRLKRFKPAARGSAHPIQKRTSHIRITLTDEIALPEPKKKKAPVAKKAAKPAAKKKAAAKPAETTSEAAE